MPVEEKYITSATGSALPLQIRMPDITAKGVVLINTGTCIPQKVYWRFADYLSENGYIAITYDYTDAQNFRSNVSHTAWLNDMESAIEFVRTEYPGLRKILVGHSSGGQLLGMLRNSQYLDRIYLVASANGYWKLMDGPAKYAMWLFWQIVVPLNVALFGYFNNRMLGAGGGFPKNIILELRSFCQRPDFFFSFFRSKSIVPKYDEIRVPVTAYHLEGDAIANERACRYILELYGNADKRFISLKAADYGGKPFGHRDFFNPRLKPVWDQMLKDWQD